MLPYENASSGKNALEDIQRTLRQFGCSKFATGEDFDKAEVFVQFEYRGRLIYMTVSIKAYAAKWLQQNPWTQRKKSTRTEWEARALEQASVSIYSILRDAIKAQVMLVELGIKSFEEVFLSDIVLPSGKSVMQYLRTETPLLPDH